MSGGGTPGLCAPALPINAVLSRTSFSICAAQFGGVPVKLATVRKYQLRYKAAVGITDVSDGIAEVLFCLRTERERKTFLLGQISG